jgi:hypothetical protein
MKVLVIIALCLVAATQARQHRRDVSSLVPELTKKFPLEEWKAFYNKLTEALGSSKGEFEKKLQENKGDMEMTLDQWKDKIPEKYPQLKTLWETQKTKFTALTEKLKTVTLKDVLDWGKDKLQKYTQNLNYNSVQDWWKDAQSYLTVWFAQMQQAAQG